MRTRSGPRDPLPSLQFRQMLLSIGLSLFALSLLPAAEPFEDLLAHKQQLPLPPRANLTPTQLTKLFPKFPGDCQLKLTAGIQTPSNKPRYSLSSPIETQGRLEWAVNSSDPQEKSPLGLFTLKDQSLLFTWDKSAADSKTAHLLRYSLLNIRINNDSHDCTLLSPLVIPPIPLDLSNKNNPQQRIKLNLDTDISLADHLTLQLDLPGVKTQAVPSTDKRPGVRSTIRFVGDSKSEDKFNRSIELDIAFASDGKGPVNLIISPYVFTPISSGKKLIDERTQLNKAGIESRKTSLAQRINQKTAKIKDLMAQTDQLEKQSKLLDQQLKQLKTQSKQNSNIGVRVRARGKGVTVPAKIPDQNADEKQDLLAQKNAIPSTITALNADKAKLEEEIKNLEKQRDWCDDMRKQFDTLQTGTQLHFRLSFGLGRDEIPLAHTRRDEQEGS